jgi:hypothetical protein
VKDLSKLYVIHSSPISGSLYADAPDPKAGNGTHTFVKVVDGEQVATLQFQHGPRNEPNSIPGMFDVDVLRAVADRMRHFQEGPFAHPTNEAALRHIEDAIAHLELRTHERHFAGKLGRNIR